MLVRLLTFTALAALLAIGFATLPTSAPAAAAPAISAPAGSYAAYYEVSASDYGKCSFDSDCHKGVKCNSSRCADSAGSKCSFDSDCGGNGAKCNSSKCSNAPDGKCSFNSECPGGSCSSGKCKW
ncbi:MAG: hypothetical protein CVU56_22815 [Deltaproteobacteria bacterium HGW-Deltaproteobacteria-14]|nr:MAG: hypothetical protein CVU56_22815 [Deltaproteobacteria bacterium HGW-Deltaproteobacteria-14]